MLMTKILPGWLSGKESTCQCRRCGFDPWVRKIPWRGKWQPTPVCLPGDSHGQRSPVGCSPWGHKESDTAEQFSTLTIIHIQIFQVRLIQSSQAFKILEKGKGTNRQTTLKRESFKIHETLLLITPNPGLSPFHLPSRSFKDGHVLQAGARSLKRKTLA